MKSEKKILPLQYIKGVGPVRAEAFAASGLNTHSDLVFYFPRAYVDRSAVSSLKALAIRLRQENTDSFPQFSGDSSFSGEVTIIAHVSSHREHQFGKRKKILVMTISDDSGAKANIVFWQFHDFFAKSYPVGSVLIISGKAELDSFGKINFNHPEIEKIEEDEQNIYREGGILPVYKLTEKMRTSRINNKVLRKIITNVLDSEINNIKEIFDINLLEKYKFPEIRDCVYSLHFPVSHEIIDISRNRMKFQEIFLYELFLAIRQRGIKISEKGLMLNPKSPRARKLFESLPFKLTRDQIKVINEITTDMNSGKPMNRLLQGDVGSGKTIVAVFAMLVAIENGYQVAFMAPTEILAEQHYHTLNNFLKGSGVNVTLLLGGQKARLRRDILEQISTGFSNIIIGTHALFESEIRYNNLALIIIDEQHRFGVVQRAAIKELSKKSLADETVSPHILVMSATPIPRTLSMTLYGDLDVSIIREMPKNRKPIKTKITFENLLPQVFEFVREKVKEGRQAYIVYPLVEKSEKLELKAATVHFEKLRDGVFPDLKCGLLHGQMFWYEKEEIMRAFLNGEFQVLVATTVIEVGIDIKNATVMVIENAERFGLSQLHQLRGRVGRGSEQSYCILVTKDLLKFELTKKGGSDVDRKTVIIRLKTMEETTDGFEIAEIDLKLRGPGDVMGTRQSGLPGFKFIDLVTDADIISKARNEAFGIINDDEHLRKQEHTGIRNEFLRQYQNSKNYFDIA